MTQTPERRSRPTLIRFSLSAVLGLAAASLLAAPTLFGADSGEPTATAAKKQKKITGTLSKGGYTVIALAKSGEAKTDRAPKGAFKLRPPAKKVTLHLRAPDGTYAGPIVVGTRKQGKRAIEGVYAGAQARQGQGQLQEGLCEGEAEEEARPTQSARPGPRRASRSAPATSASCKSKKTKGGAPGDLDLDGVADPLDIDDDGDKVLDNLDRKPREGSKARASGETLAGDFPLASRLTAAGPDKEPVNANAPGMSDARIEAALPSYGILGMSIDRTLSHEIDCGQPQGSANPGLIYCTRGGTGRLQPGGDILDPFPGEPGGAAIPTATGLERSRRASTQPFTTARPATRSSLATS